MPDYLDKFTEKKKDGTPIQSVPIRDSDAQERLATVEGKLTTDTTSASGNPLSIVGLKSTQNAINPIVTLEPIQDLHGQDKPYPAGGGKNKYVGSPYFDGYTNVSDWTKETEKYNGHDVYSNQRNWRGMYTTFTLKAGTYTFSVSAKSSTAGTSMRIFDINGTQIGSETLTTSWVKYSVTVTLAEDSTVGYRVETPTDTARLLYISEYQIEEGSTATSFAPYSNECPISGYDKIEVLSCGKNIIPLSISEIKANNTLGTWSNNKYSYNGCSFECFEDGSIKVSGTSTGAINFIIGVNKFLMKGEYTLSHGGVVNASGNSNCFAYVRDVDGNVTLVDNNLKYANSNTASISQDVNNVMYYINVSNGITLSGTIYLQLELGSTATSYEPYHKTTDLSENLPQTVYGGTLDLNSGTLSENYQTLDLSTLSWEYNNGWNLWVSPISNVKVASNNNPINGKADRYEIVKAASYTSSHSPNTLCVNLVDTIFIDNGSSSISPTGQLVYEVKNPIEIQLTPTELTLLKDYAYVSTNGTRIDLDYRNGEMATLGDVLDAQNKLQEEIDNPISYDGKNYRLGMDATGLYLYNITDDTKAYIQMVTT